MLAVAAERATPAELRSLREQRDRLEALLDDGEAFMREDLHFARLLVRATHNLALELLYNTVQRIITTSPGFEAAFLVSARETVKTYEALLDLLETREPERIRKAAGRFMEPLDRKTLDRLGALSRVLAGAEPPHPSAEADAAAAARAEMEES